MTNKQTNKDKIKRITQKYQRSQIRVIVGLLEMLSIPYNKNIFVLIAGLEPIFTLSVFNSSTCFASDFQYFNVTFQVH